MTVANEPTGYSATQIVLHWAIAALIVLQLLLGEDIKPAYRAFSRGTEPALPTSSTPTFMSMSA
ncbi:MAG: hypothetical protein ABIQ51_20155 [Mesorhizobium sp.]|uniref:hypothetical protein n=1 Tax=Mesorhizobium sp. INR15 TaxID=2654248 RepID=UPI002156517C|nr:hypothetical protein [Mesorhizobium sp. INR15]